MQVVGVPPEAAVHGVALAAALPVLAGRLALLLQSKPFMLNLETNICEVSQLWRRPIIEHGIAECLKRFLNVSFQQGEGPRRGLLCDCETSNFAKILFQLCLWLNFKYVQVDIM